MVSIERSNFERSRELFAVRRPKLQESDFVECTILGSCSRHPTNCVFAWLQPRGFAIIALPKICFSPTAESFGVSAQIGSGVVWGGPEVRFHEGSTRVPRGSARATGWYEALLVAVLTKTSAEQDLAELFKHFLLQEYVFWPHSGFAKRSRTGNGGRLAPSQLTGQRGCEMCL